MTNEKEVEPMMGNMTDGKQVEPMGNMTKVKEAVLLSSMDMAWMCDR